VIGVLVGFWTAAAAIVVTYVVLPVVVLVRGLVVRRPIAAADVTPSLTVVIAAYNEEGRIGPKLDSVLAADYPPEQLQVVVASDGSVDGTVAEARRHGGDRVEVLELARMGKADALNEAVARATGSVLVFSDANSMLARDALRLLVRPFADPSVGGVAGNQRYDDGDGGGGERAYWDLDRWLKVAESRAGNTISATGALYAVRRSLFTPVVAGVTDDFYTSTGVIVAGSRLVFEPAAAVYEPVAPSGGREFERKVRIMTRGLRGVALRRELLDPRRSGFYAVELLWHKVLRRLVAVPLLVVAICAPFLVGRGRLYRLVTAGEVGFAALAAAGLSRGERAGKVLGLPAYFCLVNAAALRAAWNVLTGRRVDRWETARTTR
jgi:GT2 family glycosyltransferase